MKLEVAVQALLEFDTMESVDADTLLKGFRVESATPTLQRNYFGTHNYESYTVERKLNCKTGP